MKHIIPTLALITLVAASAVAQVAGAKKNALSYDRVGVSWSQNDLLDGFGINGTALLGDYLLVSGSYSDFDSRSWAFSGSATGNTVGIGARIPVGPGDVIVSYQYIQIQLGGFDTSSGDPIIGAGDGDTWNVSYRAAVGGNFELSAGIGSTNTSSLVLLYDLGADTVDAAFERVSDTPINLGVRYNFSKNFDVSLGYVIADVY